MQIAIAGGSSPTLGSSIINAILATGRHTPIILSRQTNSTKPTSSSFETRYVDYSSIPSLTAALTGVDVLVSVLLIPGPEMQTYQLNLLAAAEKAGVKRFAPSEFSLPPSAQDDIDFDNIKLSVWARVQASVAAGRIDSARFPTGMWMNYLAIGCKHQQEEGLAGFQEGAFLIHLGEENPWIEVPVLGDGRYPSITMTDLRDIGRFVVAAIEMDEAWGGRELGMNGETMSMRELVRLCEEYVGKGVEAREVTEEELRERLGNTPPEEYLKRMETQISLIGCRDGFAVRPTLNGMCDVQPMSIKGFLEKYWEGKND